MKLTECSSDLLFTDERHLFTLNNLSEPTLGTRSTHKSLVQAGQTFFVHDKLMCTHDKLVFTRDKLRLQTTNWCVNLRVYIK